MDDESVFNDAIAHDMYSHIKAIYLKKRDSRHEFGNDEASRSQIFLHIMTNYHAETSI